MSDPSDDVQTEEDYFCYCTGSKPPVEAGDDSLDEVDDAPTDSAKKKDYYEDQVVGIAQGRLMVGGVLKP